MSDLIILRKRLIPSEVIHLKDDVILSRTDERIVTSWNALRPRPDLTHGYSCYYLAENLKLSRMFHSDGSCHWYFDIADYAFSEDLTTLTMTDLLTDVDVLADGRIEVLDLDELAHAYTTGLLDETLLKKSLCTTDRLLRELYKDGIERLAAPLMHLT
ncbi:MAG: DUF402 domain-containing protein [Lachnospiraceae bacterium]|nr:DUF402 domain-containing protein [Lachnospiraceae bacterium]